MRKLTCLWLAALATGCCYSIDAFASTYIIEQSQSRYIQCYSQVYVPARIQINTRGRLVRAPSKGFEVSGNSWNYVSNPPVFIQTQRVVESDHYTLVGSSCPAQ